MPTLSEELTEPKMQPDGERPSWRQSKTSREFVEIFTYVAVIGVVLALGMFVHAAFNELLEFARAFFK